MTRVIVYHASYGCETGCCGHYVELERDGKIEKKFKFAHSYGDDPRTFAEELVRADFGEAHVKDLDWANSIVVEDC